MTVADAVGIDSDPGKTAKDTDRNKATIAIMAISMPCRHLRFITNALAAPRTRARGSRSVSR